MPDKSQTEDTRRGRPELSEEQRSDMRKQIADAAMQLFRAEGYGKVSIRRIASEIGCSPMTLYKYYESKIDILRTLWAHVLEEAFDQVAAAQCVDDTPAKRLKAASSAYVAYWQEHTDHYRLVFMAEGVTQPDVNLFIDNPEIFARYSIFASAIIDAHGRDVPPEALKQKLDTLICFLHGISHSLITISGYDWSNVNNMIEPIVDALLAPSE